MSHRISDVASDLLCLPTTDLLEYSTVVDRSQFWPNIDDTKSEEKIGAFSCQQLRHYHQYFVEVQYEQDLPQHERDSASTHVTLLQREIDRRRNKWLTIASIVILALVAIGVAVWQGRPSKQSTAPSSVGKPASAAPRQVQSPPLSPAPH